MPISGTILAAKGAELPGAAILVAGITIGSAPAAVGSFFLTVPATKKDYHMPRPFHGTRLTAKLVGLPLSSKTRSVRAGGQL